MANPGRTKDSLSRELSEARRTLSQALEATASSALGDPSDSDAHHSYVLEQTGAMMVEMGPDRRITYASATSESIQGFTPDELIGDDWLERVHPDDLGSLFDFAGQLSDPKQRPKALFRIRHRDGHWVWLDATVVLRYRTDDGEVRSVSFTRDVSESRRAALELRESEERYRRVAEASRDIIAESDQHGNPLYLSPIAADTFGIPVEEQLREDAFARVHPDDREDAAKVFAEGMARGRMELRRPYRVLHSDGSWRWIRGSGMPYQRADGKTAYLTVARDVTEAVEAEIERRQLQLRMQHAQKLESLGVMAAGIAHDFNNVLTPILGEASLAVGELPEDSPARRQAEKVLRAAHRAAALTNQMLAYTGEGPLAIDSVDLGELAEEIADLLANSAPASTVVTCELDDSLPRVEGDASQLSQVVMNLITNASEAVNDAGGRVAIRTGTVTLDRKTLANTVLGDALEPGRFVYVEVADDGCGIDAATLERIFDPFFTTKFTGRGLGLAAVLGIVRTHGGAIEIDTRRGEGTRFVVYFPPSAVPASETPVESVSPIGEWTSHGTVLVIEDDPGVRAFTEDTLSRAGLDVLAAADGREGIETFRKHKDQIRLVLLDRTMPVTGGAEAFEAIRTLDPEARVVLVSGYSEEHAARRITRRELSGFLKKPFLPEELLGVVRGALRETAEGVE